MVFTSAAQAFPYLPVPTAFGVTTPVNSAPDLLATGTATTAADDATTDLSLGLAKTPNLEFVRPTTFRESLPVIYHGLRKKSGPVSNHFVSFIQGTLAIGAGAAVLGSDLTDPLSLILFGASALYYAITKTHTQTEHRVGHFDLKETIAGHAYQVTSQSQQAPVTIQAQDSILEVHIDNKKLRQTVTNRTDLTPRQILESVFDGEKAEFIATLKQIFADNPHLKAVRLTTPLNPQYLDWAKDYMINEVHLSPESRANPGRLKSFFARLLFESANQLHSLTLGRFIRFKVQRHPKFLLKQPYPIRTFIIPREDLDKLIEEYA